MNNHDSKRIVLAPLRIESNLFICRPIASLCVGGDGFWSLLEQCYLVLSRIPLHV